MKHSLSEINELDKTGYCSACEKRVKIKRKGLRPSGFKHFGELTYLWGCCIKEAEMKNRPHALLKQKLRLLQKSFGDLLDIDIEDFRTHLEKTHCECCKGSVNEVGVLAFDHCHVTNKHRGSICRSCNLALGFFKDSTNNLELAIQYLNRFTQKSATN